MTTDRQELAAARDRLRRRANGESMRRIYVSLLASRGCEDERMTYLYERDKQLCLDAYLAQPSAEQLCDRITNAVDAWVRGGGAEYGELQEVVMRAIGERT